MGKSIKAEVSRDLDELEGAGLPSRPVLTVAEAMTPVRDAKSILDQRKIEVYVIGDAKSPRNLMLAQSEAEEIGRSI